MSVVGAAKKVYIGGFWVASVYNNLLAQDIYRVRPLEAPVWVQYANWFCVVTLGSASAFAFPITTPLLYNWNTSLHASLKNKYESVKT